MMRCRNCRPWATAVWAFVSIFVAKADVVTVKDAPVVDGKLDDPCWLSAQWECGRFRTLARSPYSDVQDQTDFAVVADKDTIYVAIRAHERNLAHLKARPFCKATPQSHDVELFFSPSGDPQTFYQFCIAAPHGVTDDRYYIESGANSPDPYAPFWTHAVGFEDGAWTAEAAIPLTAFYNTRAEEWSKTWVFNVSRQDLDETGRACTHSSWSQLDHGFLDPLRYGRMTGFPLLAKADDIAVNKALATITGEKDGKLIGTLEIFTYANVATEMTFACDYAETADVTVPSGEGSFVVPCAFPKNARYDVSLKLTRRSDSKLFGRSYPVSVDYDALVIDFAKPAYRSNFYPGQDASQIEGVVRTSLDKPVKIVLEGPGIPRVEKSVKGGERFSFDTPGFKPGEAKMTFFCGNERRERTVRKLVPNGRRMSWIENGHIVIDGRPTIRRTLYAPCFRTTAPLRERESAASLHLTPEAEIMGLEPGRLVKGSEQKEGIWDDPPSKEMLAAIDRRIAELRDMDFCGYYLCDEPECRSISPMYLRHVYNYVKEKDPYHIIIICSRDPVRYIDACDTVEPHPYLCPRYTPEGLRVHNMPLNRYGSYFDCISGLDRPDKSVGHVSFAFSYHHDSPACDYATFDEYVATIWAALAEGCVSFNPFLADAIGDTWGLYRAVQYTFAQMEELEPWLLNGKRTRIARTEDYVAVKWELGGETLLALVNFKEQSRRVGVCGLKGPFYEFRGDRVVRNLWGKDELLVYLAPYETIVFSSRKLPSKYPTLKQVRARVEEEEFARLNRDNQLLLRDDQLEFSTGAGKGLFPLKLVDGVLDNYGYVPNGKEPLVEIAFPKDPLSFSEIRLFGERLDKTEVSVEHEGRMKKLVPFAVERLRDSLTLSFGEIHKADRLRLEFNDGKVVVYELEVPYVK